MKRPKIAAIKMEHTEIQTSLLTSEISLLV